MERNRQPTDEQLKAMQTALWAYMDGEGATSTTELIKQGSEIKRRSTEITEANMTALQVHQHMAAHNISKTKAVQNISTDINERTRWNRLKKSKLSNPDKAHRFLAIMDAVKKALQKKP